MANIFQRLFSKIPAATVARDSGFVDVSLSITDRRTGADGTLVLTAQGLLDGLRLGFRVTIGSEWKAKQIESPTMTLYWGKGVLASIGADSDRFVTLLAGEYGMPAQLTMKSSVPVAMVVLGTDPGSLSTKTASIKLFFESVQQENYGEAFIALDLPNKKLEFRDKDPEYHRGILGSLSAST